MREGFAKQRDWEDEPNRFIVEVRDIGDEAALCPAEAILHDLSEGRVRGDLYPAAMLDEGAYVLRFGDEGWPVVLQRSEPPPPAMVITSDVDAPHSLSVEPRALTVRAGLCSHSASKSRP
jgi:hypothetical protein